MSNEEIIKKWEEEIVKHATELDDQSDKGHDWHSLWTGFVIGCGRPDLSGWTSYMAMGFPSEKKAI
jgi:hypothetical protein